MKKAVSSVCAAILTLALTHETAAADVPRPEVWIKSGVRSANTPQVWKGMRDDTGDPWAPGAPWQTVLRHAKVVGVSPGAIQDASGPELRVALAGMKRSRVALALGTGLLTRSDRCRAHNEAMAAPGEFEQMLLKIQRNGGDLRYIVMDEPYYFGHLDPSGCHQSAGDLAANVAESIATARRIFPNVVIGDVEVLNASRPLTREIATWTDAYRSATGEKLAFMFTDIQWSGLAMRNLRPLSAELRARGIPLGIVYDADAAVQTDEAWGRSTESHIAEIEGPLGIHPDLVSFDSWTAHPRRYLPETAPWTFTNVVLRYFRERSQLQFALRGDHITGRLTDEEGRPVAGASIEITALDVGARMAPTVRTWTSETPKNAVAAIAGLRVDSEGACACGGVGTAVVGSIRYQEQRTGRRQVVPPAANPGAAPGGVRTIQIAPESNSALNPNLKQFPVTPGATYTFSAPIAATASAEHAGYGQFRLTMPQAVASAQPEIRAAFAGNQDLRGALGIAESRGN